MAACLSCAKGWTPRAGATRMLFHGRMCSPFASSCDARESAEETDDPHPGEAVCIAARGGEPSEGQHG